MIINRRWTDCMIDRLPVYLRVLYILENVRLHSYLQINKTAEMIFVSRLRVIKSTISSGTYKNENIVLCQQRGFDS